MMLHSRGCSWTGDVTTFDTSDLHIVLSKPVGVWSRSNGYVIASGSPPTNLAHMIMGKPARGMVIDHVNRNKRDNRRANLELKSHRDNMRNMTLHSDNSSGENGISEVHQALFAYHDHTKGKRCTKYASACGNNILRRDLVAEAEVLREDMSAKTMTGRVPSIRYVAVWAVSISPRSLDGGRKSFCFKKNDASDRARALREAVVYRDMLLARCNSTNGKDAAQT